ncbi:DUF1998 domain-containing protein [Roseicyclus mahoneyensis]|uniref:Uncharacterized protein DUF1998 n=1 Tax=Roseicyclus mahoneyensis TaxID=164332 RepID=A0A316G4U1_9RHOB|nr:DUF1998 domain-containing protein [Roseicyclus mahoneyensis]PWK55602.1 uncharacterized protein DUF1998 [Roseicyclus mahoneyensis]
MSKNVGSIRRSQIISTFGPGAIVDFRLPGSGALLSGVMQGLEAWEAYTKGGYKQDIVREPRLEALLGVDHFRAPPVGTYLKDGQTRERVLPIERFPDWLSCPECHVINRSGQWAPSRNGDSLHCGKCRGKPAVVPVRFVTICENGHLDDFPWMSWLTHKESCTQPVLALRTAGAGIGGLMLTCKSCGGSRSMAEAFSPRGIPKHKCRGGRPWLGGSEMGCEAAPRITQRGASNVYFSIEQSAITLPDWKVPFKEKIGDFIEMLDFLEDEAMMVSFITKKILPIWDGDESAEEIARRFREMKQDSTDAEHDLRLDEFRMLLTDTSASNAEAMTLLNRRQPVPTVFNGMISWISSVERLREVRALTGFTRLKAQVGGKPEAVPLSRSALSWLPAVAMHGEGVFLTLDIDAVSDWEKRPDVEKHLQGLVITFLETTRAEGKPAEGPPPQLSARYMLVHTLAHALVVRLSLDSGYSSSALRERLYVGPDMAGLLIYTSTPDADGTMGGLSRQARPARMEQLVLQALADHELCSADPLCSEGMARSGSNGNHAACHNCVFLPETSCEVWNGFLDRTLLSAGPLAFFSRLLA